MMLVSTILIVLFKIASFSKVPFDPSKLLLDSCNIQRNAVSFHREYAVLLHQDQSNSAARNGAELDVLLVFILASH